MRRAVEELLLTKLSKKQVELERRRNEVQFDNESINGTLGLSPSILMILELNRTLEQRLSEAKAQFTRLEEQLSIQQAQLSLELKAKEEREAKTKLNAEKEKEGDVLEICLPKDAVDRQ